MIKTNIGIIGLGYVGAPLAYLSSIKGYNVIGIDNDSDARNRIINKINIPKQLKSKKSKIDIKVSSDYSLVKDCDIIIICVPTPTRNNKPDLEIIENVITNISKYIKKECLIIIESTIAPGMTKKYVEQFLRENAKLQCNEDYYLAYCPERIDPGNKRLWVGNINRVCGASSKKALNRTVKFYKSIIDAEIYKMNSIEEAELVKVWENSMRNIRIAQANLLAIICDKYGFSVNDIMQATKSKYEQFDVELPYPGIGPGGHCIPEDIHYLIQTAEDDINMDMSLLKEAVNINEKMPNYAFNKLLNEFNQNEDNFKEMKILMLGISYKPNVRDCRRSQALVLYDLINKMNNNNEIYDPYFNEFVDKKEINKVLKEKIKNSDIIVVGCAHSIFLDMDFTKFKNIKYILDCYNKLDKEKIEKAGIKYIGVGI